MADKESVNTRKPPAAPGADTSLPPHPYQAELFNGVDSWASNRNLDVILHLSEYSDSILIITGTERDERQAFLRALLQRKSQAQHFNVMQARAADSAETLVDGIYQAIFNSPPAKNSTPNDRRQRILNFQYNRDEQKMPPLLVISEAHALDRQRLLELRRFLTLDSSDQHLTANLIMVADDGFIDRIDPVFSGLNRRHYTLPTLTQVPPRDARPERAGRRGPNRSEPAITSPAANLNVDGAPTRRRPARTGGNSDTIGIEQKVTRRQILLMALVTLLLGVVWTYQDDINGFVTARQQSPASTGTTTPDQAAGNAATALVDSGLFVTTPLDQAAPAPEAEMAEAPLTEQAPKAEEVPMEEKTAVAAETPTVEPARPATDPQAEQLQQHHAWIRQQPPAYHTIQVFGSHGLAEAQKLVDRHKLAAQGHIFRSTHNNKAWFSVIVGAYRDKQSARAAVKTLPRSLQKSSWIRPFKQIQAILVD